MQENERFERYTPQFPLPVDITTMSRQDTVCQFCGVSYLIHNEIKALELKCEKLEKELARYVNLPSREAALEESLEKERTLVRDLQKLININTLKFDELIKDLQLTQKRLKQSEENHQKTKEILSEFRHVKDELVLLKDFYLNQRKKLHEDFRIGQTSLQREIQNQIEKFQNELNEKKRTNETLRIQYERLTLETKENEKKFIEKISKFELDVQIAKETIRKQIEEISQIEQNRSKIQIELEETKKQLNEKIEAKRNVDRMIDQIRDETTNEKQIRLSKENELKNLTIEYERKIEMNEETIRSRQAVLDRTRDEYEKLLSKYHELDELHQTLIDKRNEELVDNETIRRELENLHQENVELTKQKETLQIVHEIQMKKLQENYSERIRDAEQWPDRLQSELNREREQHRIELIELERRLKENFAAELNIEKEKSLDLMKKYENERGVSTQQLRHELISTEKVTLEQRHFYEEQIEQMKKDKKKLKDELETLRNVLKELHEQINQQESKVDHRVDVLQLKEELLAKETKLFQSQSTIVELQKELEQAKEEMNTLQETVHRECLEREELKDSLIEARQQLLTLKKNGILNGTAPLRNHHSPPMAFDNIERRVSGPLPLSNHFHSEPTSRDGSVAEQMADPSARPMSSNRFAPTRPKALPPIRSQTDRRHDDLSTSNKAEQLLQNKQRIARFIKTIK